MQAVLEYCEVLRAFAIRVGQTNRKRMRSENPDKSLEEEPGRRDKRNALEK